MFINYLTLLLINMAAGFVILAVLLLQWREGKDLRHWTPALAVTGLVALAGGCHMVWTWPLPGAFNSLFGELSVLYGATYVGLALACAMRWKLSSIALYALFGGLAAILLGVRVMHLGMTKSPVMAGVGFIVTGLAAAMLLPAVHFRSAARLRRGVAVLLIVAALIWALIGYMAFWGHMKMFSGYKPETMQATESGN